MKYGYSDNKQALERRLNRIEGQVRGINRMVQDDKYCIDILTQVSAIRSALDKVTVELVRDHAAHCLSHHGDVPSSKDKADELATAIARML